MFLNATFLCIGDFLFPLAYHHKSLCRPAAFRGRATPRWAQLALQRNKYAAAAADHVSRRVTRAVVESDGSGEIEEEHAALVRRRPHRGSP